MVRFDDIVAFVRSAAAGSFSGAAREIDVSPAQISVSIKRLEIELGVRLFARSTRSLRLTLEGARYLPYATQAVSTLFEGQEQLVSRDENLTGILQISAPSDLGRNVLCSPLINFRREHPDLELRIFLSDQLTDIFREPVDVALRYGVLDNASFVSLPIVPENRRVLFASPEYLNRRGRPASLDDLRLHDCLIYTLGGRPYDSWEFPESPLGPLSIDVAGPLLSNDADMIRRWALAGQGIGYKSLLDVEEDVFSGRLERILPAMKGKLSPLNLICPHRRQLTPAVQKLYAYLREYFQSRNYSRSQEEVVV